MTTRYDDTLMGLRLRHVWRWTIVNLPRRQSVAEHSFLVWVLGMHLYDNAVTRGDSLERCNFSERLLMHDFDEAFSGDIPSNIKRALERTAPGALARAIREAVGVSTVILSGHFTDELLHIADSAEAILFCLDNWTGDAERILPELYIRVDACIARGKKKCPTDCNWDIIPILLEQTIGPRAAKFGVWGTLPKPIARPHGEPAAPSSSTTGTDTAT